jgi:pseudouridine synthase
MALNTEIRLQKFLSQCGIASRRQAEDLIKAGRIQVNGRTVTDMGIKIDPNQHEVRFDGAPITLPKELIYILLNKPKGYVTTLSDPQGRPIVTSLVKDIPERLFPVGRLDLDTEGALILTNDGEFAQRIQHPSHEITKTYEAQIAGHPSQNQLRQLAEGILIDDKITARARITIMKRKRHTTLVQITIHEGRKRQVKRMFEAIAHPVVQLKRIAYGRLKLNNLESGKYRRLTSGDLEKIFLEFPLQTSN